MFCVINVYVIEIHAYYSIKTGILGYPWSDAI